MSKFSSPWTKFTWNNLPSGIQIVQQIITPTGEIHQIPIQLNAQQLQVRKHTFDQPSDHLQTNWPSLEQIDHLEHADHPRPSWPPSPSQRWSEPRWWEGQALRSPLSSKPPQSRLKLLSLLRLTWIAVLKNVNFCTNYTPLNVTNWKNSKLICLFHIPDWPDNSTSRGPAGKRTLFALCSCQDIFF